MAKRGRSRGTRTKDGSAGESYARHRERQAASSRSRSAAAREVGEIPRPAHPRRRSAAEKSLRRFCETYLRATFHLGWSADQLRAIELIERVMEHGGQYVLALPRGSGKTTLCEAAVAWAILSGRRRAVMLIGPDEQHAAERAENIRTILESNDLVAEDWPEICIPLREMQGVGQRRLLYHGKLVRQQLTGRRLVLARCEKGGVHLGGILWCAGITGKIRGANYRAPDGQTVRPELILVDDPQTDQSARSPWQCDVRESILCGAVLGLAGPRRRPAVFVTITPINPGDLAERLLDRQRHPDWRGERGRALVSFPKRMDLWEQYWEVRCAGLAAGDDGEAGRRFYAGRRKEMDEGAEVAWPERHDPKTHLSALQALMDAYFADPQRFKAEFQCEAVPLQQSDDGLQPLRAQDLLLRVTSISRGTLPQDAELLTGFIDVQRDSLWWLIAAWRTGFGGLIVDWGVWPPQPRRGYHRVGGLSRTIQRVCSGGLEAQIYQAVVRLLTELLERSWPREGGGEQQVERLLVDANWGLVTDSVYQAVAEVDRGAGRVYPSHGRGIGPTQRPMHEWPLKRGERAGDGWRLRRPQRRVRGVTFDANWWKSILHSRLTAPLGSPDALVLPAQSRGEQRERQALVDHLASERPVAVEAKGRRVEQWELLPARENHWWDCLVGSAVAASIAGLRFSRRTESNAASPQRLKLSDLQSRKRRRPA